MDLAAARKASDERRLFYILAVIGIAYLTVVLYLVLSTFGWQLLYIPATIFALEFVLPTVHSWTIALLDFFGLYNFCLIAVAGLFWLRRVRGDREDF